MVHGRLQIQGALAAFTCSMCFIIGVVTLKWIAPDIYVFPQGRLRVIEAYGGLLHLWHFIIFPLVGLSVLFLNYTLVKQSSKPAGRFAALCTLLALVTFCHDVAIFTIETLSNELFLKQHFDSAEALSQQTITIYSLLIQFRASTEWGIDVWLCSMSLFLLLQKRFNPIVSLWGIGVGVFGILVMFIPSLYFLEFAYLSGMIVWFFAVGCSLAINKPRASQL